MGTENITWKAHWTLEKFMIGKIEPYDVVEIPGNLLTYEGASSLWEYAIGNGTNTSGQTFTYLNNANTYLGVGDSSTAASVSQTDLVASSNKVRVAMDSAYPLHNNGGISGSAQIAFRSTFATTDGNFDWNELGLFNAVSGGRMINRKVISGGTKTSAQQWVLTLTITLA